jgi:WD40 repeat protein
VSASLPVRSAGTETAFSPSGDRLAVLRTDGSIEEWDVDSGALVRGPYLAPGVQQLIGYTTDGYLVTAQKGRDLFDDPLANRLVQLWDLTRGTVSGTVALTDNQLVSVSPTSDPLQLDGISRMPATLPLTAARWAERLCPLVHDYTPAQRAALPPVTTAPPPCPS